MDKITTGIEALAVLKSIDAGTISVNLADDKQDVFCNNVDYVASNGWKFTVFIDCGEWDYIDHLSSPNGDTLDYDELNDIKEIWELLEWEPDNPELWIEAKVNCST